MLHHNGLQCGKRRFKTSMIYSFLLETYSNNWVYRRWGSVPFYGTKKPDSERLAFLDHAYASGEWNWDSADMYDDNEDLIGEWFKRNPEKRKDVSIVQDLRTCLPSHPCIHTHEDIYTLCQEFKSTSELIVSLVALSQPC